MMQTLAFMVPYIGRELGHKLEKPISFHRVSAAAGNDRAGMNMGWCFSADDEKDVLTMHTLGGDQKPLIVSESGLARQAKGG